jgi:hypothetical protein
MSRSTTANRSDAALIRAAERESFRRFEAREEARRAAVAAVVAPEPVFGPGRPDAAVAAIRELSAAEAQMTGWADYDTQAMSVRLALARLVRAQYSQYGDSFGGH